VILGTDKTFLRTQFKKRPTMPAKEKGEAVLTIHQSCDRVEGEDKDGQCGHIIRPSWVLYLPAGYSCIEQVLRNIQNNIIILLLEKTSKAKFLFTQRYK
jgi:hypothetical protein